MFKFDEKELNEFEKDINDFTKSVNELNKLFTPKYFNEHIWPKVKLNIINYLKQNMEAIKEQPISDKWRDTKRELASRPISEYPRILMERGFPGFTTQRKGDQWLEIIKGGSENWVGTGTMEETILSQLDSNQGSVSVAGDEFIGNIDVDISGLNDLYPNDVDEKLMELSSGNMGIMRLVTEQQNEIYKMLMEDTVSLSEKLFGEKGGVK